MQKNELLIWISRLIYVSIKKLNKLLEEYKDLNVVFNLDEESLLKFNFTEFEKNEILNEKYRKDLNKYAEYLEKSNIKILFLLDKEYPNKLKNIYDPPIALYVKGNIDILNERSISIVGSRDCSNYGRNIAQKISYMLASKDFNIISGLARGIDTAAHMGAVTAKGKTIAVMGTGLDIIYPSENKQLAKKIVDGGGAIVTEFPIESAIQKMNFPKRNRIISGLSDGVLIVEAKEKSGALITADFALEHGKNIYAIPGNITSINSAGTNALIKLGAKPVTSITDITEDF